MIPFEQAVESIKSTCQRLEAIEVSLVDAVGKVLARDVATDLDIPPFSKSLVDGFAIQLTGAGSGKRVYRVVDHVAAGGSTTTAVDSETAIRIMTGAPLPEQANAVVMIEDVEQIDAQTIAISLSGVSPGQFILPQAVIAAENQPVVRKGTLIQNRHLGILAESGCPRLSVFRQPSVAVLTTGNEIVPVEQIPGVAQIRNSNGPLIRSLARRGAERVNDLGHARDEQAELSGKIATGLESDLLVITGGVSMGDLDLIPGVLQQLDVKQVFHRINLKPGKPVWFGYRDTGNKRCCVFGLPGNPVSSLVCFELLVRTAINQLSGHPAAEPRLIPAVLVEPFANRGHRLLFQPGRFNLETREVEPLKWKGSADQLAIAEANCLVRFHANDECGAGAIVDVYRFAGE